PNPNLLQERNTETLIFLRRFGPAGVMDRTLCRRASLAPDGISARVSPQTSRCGALSSGQIRAISRATPAEPVSEAWQLRYYSTWNGVGSLRSRRDRIHRACTRTRVCS